MSAHLLMTLTAIATEATTATTTPCTETIDNPHKFLTHLFRYLSDTAQPITRHGMDRMMDALFADKTFAPLLETEAAHQAAIADQLKMSELFKAHWKHIIIPAWNQHAEINSVCNSSR